MTSKCFLIKTASICYWPEEWLRNGLFVLKDLGQSEAALTISAYFGGRILARFYNLATKSYVRWHDFCLTYFRETSFVLGSKCIRLSDRASV